MFFHDFHIGVIWCNQRLEYFHSDFPSVEATEKSSLNLIQYECAAEGKNNNETRRVAGCVNNIIDTL